MAWPLDAVAIHSGGKVMKKLLLAVPAFAALVVGPAMAADLAAKAPSPVPTFGWTGCYIGGNLGGGWSYSNFGTVMDLGNPLRFDFDVATVSAAGTGSATDNGTFVGGGQVGCNWQSGYFVVGLEGDIDAFRANSTLVGTGAVTGFLGFPFEITNSVSTTWLATVRPRVGVAYGHSLLYVTGGVAVTNVRYTQTYSDNVLFGPPFAAVGASSVSQTKVGWTVGGGWEYAFTDNWSVKAEYLYVRFSSISTVGTVTDGLGGTNALHGTADLQENIFRVGLNYRFGGPIVARY
jgi:outer membrane immunogenic protein